MSFVMVNALSLLMLSGALNVPLHVVASTGDPGRRATTIDVVTLPAISSAVFSLSLPASSVASVEKRLRPLNDHSLLDTIGNTVGVADIVPAHMQDVVDRRLVAAGSLSVALAASQRWRYEPIAREREYERDGADAVRALQHEQCEHNFARKECERGGADTARALRHQHRVCKARWRCQRDGADAVHAAGGATIRLFWSAGIILAGVEFGSESVPRGRSRERGGKLDPPQHRGNWASSRRLGFRGLSLPWACCCNC